MKKSFLLTAAIVSSLAFVSTSCEEDDVDPVTVTIDSSQPQGTITVSKSGTFIAQNDAPTQGMAELVQDESGAYFVSLSDDFTTQLATGTVSLFLAQQAAFKTGMPDGTQRAVGAINSNGAQSFKVVMPEGVGAFTHVVLWCSTAGVQFGYAPLAQ